VIPLTDLVAQYQTIKTEIDEAIARVIASGRFILGPEVEKLEAEVAQYIGVNYAVGVASGTDALYLSLKALGIGRGDKVITTPFTFIATAESIMRCGARPVFVDVGVEANIDISLVENYLMKTNEIKAIIPVHLYGNPVSMRLLCKIADNYGILVVEDCAQALGTSCDGRMVGSFGAAGCLSFFPSKTLGCAGDGGMVVTNNKVIADIVRKFRNHGASGHYMYDDHGLNSRLDELQAAILRVKLKHIDEWIQARRAKANYYDKLLGKHPHITPIVDGVKGCSYNYYTVLADRRNELQECLTKNGIQTQVYYPLALHLQKVYKYLGYKKGDFPIAEALQEKVLSLPLYPELPIADIEFVCDEIKDFYSK
jgi:dTDP-4-amino-4,6-dideoxygalactose transaminase